MRRRGRWNILRSAFCLLLHCTGCLSLNPEGLVLLEFRSGVVDDPSGAFGNWNSDDENPCNWSGVHCMNGKVETLHLNELSLSGVLAPELGKLSYLKALVLHNNYFTGVIPREITTLTMLELLDLRSNNLSGIIPIELGYMLSLKCLLLRDNKFQGGIPPWIEKVDFISDLKHDSDRPCQVATENGCSNRKVRHCLWQKGLEQPKKPCTPVNPIHRYARHGSSQDTEEKNGDNLIISCTEPYIKKGILKRRVLLEASNLPAIPSTSAPNKEIAEVPSMGSGSFQAVSSSRNESGSNLPPTKSPITQEPTNTKSNEDVSTATTGIWVYVLIIVVIIILLLIAAILFVLCRRKKGENATDRKKTGLSGQLKKALVSGVPKLNRAELEAACEDFSNIITSFPSCTLYKGTLSSGVEISVVSTTIKSSAEWAERSELCFRNKIDTLSRINHKNFVNLVGYCEENSPFTRMMVFEYTPNGTLSDHLHVKDYEPLDWSARMRVIMGISYFLQYVHHELSPPVSLSDLHSNAVIILDDLSAKIVDISIFNEACSKNSIHGGDGDEGQSNKPSTDPVPEGNVYSFGMLLLEIISGRLPYSDEGSILDWGANFLDDERNFSSMVDPNLKTSNDNELNVICELIRSCLCNDLKNRPTMKEVTTALRNVLGITPEAAAPRSSPLWWAELEILSVEAS